MTKYKIKRMYFEWMCMLISDERSSKSHSYSKLLDYLHKTEFTYILPMDGNRAEDGVDLRYRFGYENSYEDAVIADCLDDKPCSVLEMMVALAIRCEVHIMDDPEIGDRTGKWFWDMISSLGLNGNDDIHFKKEYIDVVISKFLARKYRCNGSGGLFTVKHSKRDMRSAEIWYQMCWYLNDIL